MPRTFRRKPFDSERQPFSSVQQQDARSPFAASHDVEAPTTLQRKMQNPKLQLKRAQAFGFKLNRSEPSSRPAIQRLTINNQDMQASDKQDLEDFLHYHHGIVFDRTANALLDDMIDESASYADSEAFYMEFRDRLNAAAVSGGMNHSMSAMSAMSVGDISGQFGMGNRGFRQSAKSAYKSGKHKLAAGKRSTYGALGFANSYRQANSGAEEQLGVLNSQIDEDLGSDKSQTSKAISGTTKMIGGNLEAGIKAGVKARRVGAVKDSLQQLATVSDQSYSEEDVMELIQAASSLKGALKRQAFYETTIGTLKQALSVTASVLLGAPGLTSVAESTATEAAAQGGSSATSAAGGQGLQKLSPKKMLVGGGNKLDEDAWTNLLTKYLSSPHPLQSQMANLIRAVFSNEQKAERMVSAAARNPRIVAKILVARQQGAAETKQALKNTKKSYAARTDL